LSRRFAAIARLRSFAASTGSPRACCAKWRDQALEAAAERFESGQERSLQTEQRRRIRELERALGRKTYELEIAGEALRGWE
jgi:hypothetical protein